MPMTTIAPAEYDSRGVPLPLQRAVRVLNEAIAIDARIVKILLEAREMSLNPELSARFEAHPSIVVRGIKDGPVALTALGLLAGCVNEGKYRLMVSEEDNGDWVRFNVVEVG